MQNPGNNTLLILIGGLLLARLEAQAVSQAARPAKPLQIKTAVLKVEIADTPDTRSAGLMHRKNLDEDAGMLFVFEDVRRRSFWMKNTTIPLSIAFIDGRGVIVQIMDMEPLQTDRLYTSSIPCRYALEVNQGWFTKNRIEVGDVIPSLQ